MFPLPLSRLPDAALRKLEYLPISVNNAPRSRPPVAALGKMSAEKQFNVQATIRTDGSLQTATIRTNQLTSLRFDLETALFV